MDAKAADRAGEVIATARHSLTMIEDLPTAIRPMTEADGYAVQAIHLRQLAKLIGSRGSIGGYKVGLVSAQMRAACGGTATLGFDAPVFGGVLVERTVRGSATVPYAQAISPFVEGEFAVRIGADVPRASAPYTRDSVATFVEACAGGIEIVDPRLRYFDFKPPLAPLMVADDGSNWGVVVGEGRTDWRNLDLRAARCTLAKNGQAIASGVGADLQGHPFEVLAWLANALLARGSMLRRGDVVLLGSVTPSYTDLDDDCEIVCAWDTLGSCRVRFTGKLTDVQKRNRFSPT